MRLLRTLAPLACLIAIVQMTQHPEARPAPKADTGMKILPGPQDVLYAAVGDANYQYGPSLRTLNARAAAMAALGGNVNSSTFQVTYDAGFNANTSAQAAFQAAINIWQTVVTSPAGIPIKVNAKFDTNFPSASILGSAGPTVVCAPAGGQANAFYSAALANVKNGNSNCTDASGFEISAHFNSSFTNWDFGTTGTPVPGKYNFETVVLHEVGHGLGFYGSMQSSAGIGSHFYDSTNPGFVDIFDKFIIIGAPGPALTSIATPSQALHQQLTGNNLFFSGTTANANNSGIPPKIESHNMTTQYGVTSDNGFLQGSSYSHVDDVLYSNTPNGLMTWQLQQAEVYTDPGPIMRGVFADEGWTIQPGGCTFSIAPVAVTVGPTASGGGVSLTASPTSCAWTASSGNTSIATIASATSGTGNATVLYNVLANPSVGQRSVNLTIGGQIFTITQNGTGPTFSLDRSSLNFSGVNNGTSFTSQTGSQIVRMTETGTGPVSWTATPSVPWLSVSPTSGSGSANFTISTVWTPTLSATQVGTVTIALTGAGNTAGPINVTLNSIAPASTAAPIGSFDTPLNGATGLAGSVPVTGWTLDDVGVSRVTICRSAITGETLGLDARCNNQAQQYIGDAIFIDGARPDVAGTFPSAPINTRAGWGYLMLTNFLPNLGNGTFTFTAYSFDLDGHIISLGSKTVTCNNNGSANPFGAIDTPAQGEVISGSYTSFGWVLSPGAPKADGADGGTVQVFVDGTNIGTPGGWGARSDLTSLFPAAQYSGVGKALAVIGINSTAFSNGIHTYVWNVTDTAAHSGGIGSRFIGVSNGGETLDPNAAQASNVIAASNVLDFPRAAALRIGSSRSSLLAEVDRAPSDLTAIQGRRGFDLDRALQAYPLDGGRWDVQAEELDRIELHLSTTSGHQYSGYLRTAGGLMPLPIGSRLDASTGEFTWMPGVGFYGVYDLVFVRWTNGIAAARQDVRITLNAKGSNRVGPQTIIDAPSTGGTVRSTFFLGGWAADLDSAVDTGVATVHVWAYPVDANGNRQDPQFLGAATYGGPRPDVAAVYGERFLDSGYGMIVQGLAPGTYDIAVFGLSTVVGNFTSAKVVRVTVR